MFSSKFKFALASIATMSAAVTGSVISAGAAQINTAGKTGAYHGQFCPALQKVLKTAHFEFSCVQSKGSAENLSRIKNQPADLGFSQYDVFALESARYGASRPFKAIRSDVARECLFFVTRNEDLENFGQIAINARDLHFILPPVGSGSAATFDFLQQIDPDGLGLATNISYAKNTDDALNRTLKSREGAVTMFVQFPDPDNERFKKINELGGHFVPAIERNILRQQIAGEKIYFAQSTEVSNPKLWKAGTKVVTACTPLVIFTGNPDQFPPGKARLDHEDLIRTISSISRDKLLPQEGFFKRFWRKTKALSATSIEKMMDASEKAREAARPMMEKAKEMGKSAVEKSKPMMEKAKEMGKSAMEKSKPMMEKAKEMGKSAMEKGKTMMEKAKEGTKEMMDKAKEKMNQ